MRKRFDIKPSIWVGKKFNRLSLDACRLVRGPTLDKPSKNNRGAHKPRAKINDAAHPSPEIIRAQHGDVRLRTTGATLRATTQHGYIELNPLLVRAQRTRRSTRSACSSAVTHTIVRRRLPVRNPLCQTHANYGLSQRCQAQRRVVGNRLKGGPRGRWSSPRGCGATLLARGLVKPMPPRRFARRSQASHSE